MLILERINDAIALLTDLDYKLNGWGVKRPIRGVSNDIAWKYWYQSLNEKEKWAERELRRIGYYNHEGTDTMFNCLDSKGQQIHTDDQVMWENKPCMVTCIFTEQEIQINPLGEGLPELVHPATVEVTQSFIEKLKKLSTIEELQEILKNAEQRLSAEMAERKSTRAKSTEGTKSKAPKKVVVQAEAEEL